MAQQVIVGGGIIGLSIAYELATRGQSVTLLERDRFGQQASWAGAGILIPANPRTAIHPIEHLEALSHEIHERWSRDLLKQTGIENGFRKCGGLYLARTSGEVAALSGMMAEWKAREIEHEMIDQNVVKKRFNAFWNDGSATGKIRKAIWVPGESQFSNPQHLEALVEACRELGVDMKQELGDARLNVVNRRIESVVASDQTFRGDNYIFAGGPWTEKLVEPTKVPLPMQPVRGQIVLYKIPPNTESSQQWPVVNEGSRYLVPRSDGHVLAGATIEEVGFDCQTTESEVRDLRRWAESLVGRLDDSTYVKSWAGLRPGTYDGFPYLGPLGDIPHAFVATGHFKAGLHLSTGTAIVMADLVEGKTPPIDLRPFLPARVADHQSINNQ